MAPSDGAARAGVGLIVPPQEVRAVVEKTAEAVSRKPALEAVIKARCADQPKFSFLFENDPYYPFYKSKLQEQTSATPPTAAKPKPAPDTAPFPAPPPLAAAAPAQALLDDAVTTTAAPVVSKLRLARAKSEAARPVPTEAPVADAYTVTLPSPVPGALELDVMKLTAQYAAANGTAFESALQRNEARNTLFDFMRVGHAHHALYAQLRAAYKAVLAPAQGADAIAEQLRDPGEELWKRAWHKLDWVRLEAERRARDAPARAPVAAAIDWHDFTPVATLDINSDDETLPSAVTDTRALPGALAAAEAAARRRAADRSAVDMDMDMDMDTDDVHVADVHAPTPAPVAIPIASARPPMNTAPHQLEPRVQLPSGQVVPRSQADNAVRVELHDASYKDERARAADKHRQKNLASDEELVRTLGRLNQSRSAAAGEVYNNLGLQAELAARRASSNPPPSHSLDAAPPEKRARIEAARAALNTRPNMVPGPEDDLLVEDNTQNASPPPPPAGLVSADEWIARVGAAVPVKIQVAKHPNKAWDCNGQEIEMKAPLQNTVGELKKYLAGVLKVPANKQKLQCAAAGFMKDKMALAYYNINKNDFIKFEIKERGKKKRGTAGQSDAPG